MSVTRRNGCADPMGAPPRGRRRSVSWPGAETNLDVETVLAALILGVLADQRGGGCEIRTREGLPPTRFPSVRPRPLGESSAGKLTGPAPGTGIRRRPVGPRG